MLWWGNAQMYRRQKKKDGRGEGGGVSLPPEMVHCVE